MKLTTLLIFAGIMQIHASVYSQNIFNLRQNNVTVKEVLNHIEKNSDYTVFYRNDQVDLNKKINVSLENAGIESVMAQALQDQPLTFELVDKMVVIKSADKSDSRDYTITGTVTDEAGEALIGASVNIKGTTRGASTDVSGRFTLRITGDAATTLVVKYIGFQDKEIAVSPGQSEIGVRLAAASATLEEVVVVGYGAVKRRDLTGSVASVKSEDIVRSPTHNAVEAIQGRVAGVDITRSSGAAGSGSNIVVRGNKSIASRDLLAERNGPLYIIDGFQGGDISTLNTNDIESIEVLKDASATAIYGALGANGVIIVTTKKGAAGKTNISYNAYYGKNQYSYPELRTGEEYMNLRRAAFSNPPSGTPIWNSPADDEKLFPNLPGELAAYQNNQWIDWLDLIIQDGSVQNHDLSLRTGTEKTKIFASAGYFREEGMLRNNTYNRYNGRFNVDQTINKWATAGVQTQLTYFNQNNRRDPLSVATSISPFGVPYDENGVVIRNPIGGNDARISPLVDERSPYVSRDNNIRTNIIANGYVSLKPIKGVTFRTSLGTNFNFNRRGVYNDKTSLAQQNNPTISVSSSSTGFTRYLNWDNVLTYTKDIEDHSFTVTGITSYIRQDVDNLSASGNNQPLASQLFYDLNGTSTATTRSIGSGYEGYKNMAYAGRLNYSYKGKYILYLSGRYDGASRLSEGNKWHFFPSAGVSWNASDESFMKQFDAISNLKVRATYGVSGNYVIPIYGTQSVLLSNARMGFGDTPAQTYQFSSIIGNPSLEWEKSEQTNLGFDLGVLKNRITATVDFYQINTRDILMPRTLPQSSGLGNNGIVYQNIASTRNRGVELAINSTNIQNKQLRWTSALTFTRNKEEIRSLINGKDIITDETNSLLLGKPISSFYTFDKLGIWQLNEEEAARQMRINSATGNTYKPGDIKVRDINGDGIIDATNDRTYIGSSVPDWTVGLQNTLNYKGFDLGLFLFARYGQMIEAQFLGRFNPGGLGNSPAVIDYWTPENPTNGFPRPRQGEANLTNYMGYQSLRFVDGSFLKIKNITLGYTVPKSLSSKVYSNNIRFYLTGSNLLTFTKSKYLKDYDPERGGAESGPLSRQFVFGVNLGL